MIGLSLPAGSGSTIPVHSGFSLPTGSNVPLPPADESTHVPTLDGDMSEYHGLLEYFQDPDLMMSLENALADNGRATTGEANVPTGSNFTLPPADESTHVPALDGDMSEYHGLFESFQDPDLMMSLEAALADNSQAMTGEANEPTAVPSADEPVEEASKSASGSAPDNEDLDSLFDGHDDDDFDELVDLHHDDDEDHSTDGEKDCNNGFDEEDFAKELTLALDEDQNTDGQMPPAAGGDESPISSESSPSCFESSPSEQSSTSFTASTTPSCPSPEPAAQQTQKAHKVPPVFGLGVSLPTGSGRPAPVAAPAAAQPTPIQQAPAHVVAPARIAMANLNAFLVDPAFADAPALLDAPAPVIDSCLPMADIDPSLLMAEPAFVAAPAPVAAPNPAPDMLALLQDPQVLACLAAADPAKYGHLVPAPFPAPTAVPPPSAIPPPAPAPAPVTRPSKRPAPQETEDVQVEAAPSPAKKKKKSGAQNRKQRKEREKEAKLWDEMKAAGVPNLGSRPFVPPTTKERRAKKASGAESSSPTPERVPFASLPPGNLEGCEPRFDSRETWPEWQRMQTRESLKQPTLARASGNLNTRPPVGR